MKAGFYVYGAFLGAQHIQGTDRETGETYERDYVAIAVGTDAYRVYLGKGEVDAFKEFGVGDMCAVACRPSVSSRGALTLSRGKLAVMD